MSASSSSASVEQKSEVYKFLQYLFAGAGAGALADGFMHPVDTIRARLIVQKEVLKGATSGVAAAAAAAANTASTATAATGANPAVYKGLVDAFFKIVRTEGWKPLYKGFGIVLAGTTPAHALYFGGYEISKKLFRPDVSMNEKGPLVHLASGFVAELGGASIWCPMDVVKQRLQIEKNSATVEPKYKNSVQAVKVIYREEGIRAFFKGFWASVVTYGPFASLYFVIYEQSKLAWAKLSGDRYTPDKLPMPMNLTSGFVAGALAAAATTPLDVIKTRLQVQGKQGAAGQQFYYKNGIDAAIQIWKQEGSRAFTKGMSARTMWIAPGTAITIASYEEFKRFYDFIASKI